MNRRKAFTMIEVLMGICIFSLAILPIVWLNSRQTKSAFSAGKHMMAGQLAASYMDNLLKRPYKELAEKVTVTNTTLITGDVLQAADGTYENMFDLQETLGSINSNNPDDEVRSVEDNMKNAFKNFKYKIELTKKESSTEKVIRIDVEVLYLVEEGDRNRKSEQSVKLTALKYGNLDG